MRLRSLRILLPAVFLFTLWPAAAPACSLCVESQVHLIYPPLYSSSIILAVWGLFLIPVCLAEESRPTALRLILHIVLFIGLSCLLNMGGIFLYLLFLFIKLGWTDFRNYRRGEPPHLSKYRLAVHGIAAVALILAVGAGYYQRSQLGQLGLLREYVHPGTGPSRGLAEKIGKDPSFDVEDLRPMLAKKNHSDSTKAFEVLYQRKKMSDLIALEDIVLQYPAGDYTLSNGSRVYLPLWLSSLGAEEMSTKQQLRDWIGKKKESSGEGSEADANAVSTREEFPSQPE